MGAHVLRHLTLPEMAAGRRLSHLVRVVRVRFPPPPLGVSITQEHSPERDEVMGYHLALQMEGRSWPPSIKEGQRPALELLLCWVINPSPTFALKSRWSRVNG